MNGIMSPPTTQTPSVFSMTNVNKKRGMPTGGPVKQAGLKGQETKANYGMQNMTAPTGALKTTGMTQAPAVPNMNNNPMTKMSDNIGKDKPLRSMSAQYGLSKTASQRNPEMGIDHFGKAPVGMMGAAIGKVKSMFADSSCGEVGRGINTKKLFSEGK